MMKKFYEQGGVTISEASMEKEFDDPARPSTSTSSSTS